MVLFSNTDHAKCKMQMPWRLILHGLLLDIVGSAWVGSCILVSHVRVKSHSGSAQVKIE